MAPTLLGELMVQQNHHICIYLDTNMFTGLGANGSETDFQNCEYEKHVISSRGDLASLSPYYRAGPLPPFHDQDPRCCYQDLLVPPDSTCRKGRKRSVYMTKNPNVTVIRWKLSDAMYAHF